jgi:hypothetical protein
MLNVGGNLSPDEPRGCVLLAYSGNGLKRMQITSMSELLE